MLHPWIPLLSPHALTTRLASRCCSFLVGAMDGNALAALVNDGVPAFAMPGLEDGQLAPKWEVRLP